MTEHIDKFRDIRPLIDGEVDLAIEGLINNEIIKSIFQQLDIGISWEKFVDQLRQCHTVDSFKRHISYHIVMSFAKKHCFSLTASGQSQLKSNKGYTYISNHRDIILDSAFLNVLLCDSGRVMPEIAIGDNLLIYPWIETLVKLNGSFIVKRNLQGRDILLAAKKLSDYMHHNITIGHSQWIAQREGRAKDSTDKTQQSLIKMLVLGHTNPKNICEAICHLNIVPVTCSYEYDPCDYLKAREMQMKRDNPTYQKTEAEDGLNMKTGLLGYKGRVHFTIGKPLNELISIDRRQFDTSSDEIIHITHLIDKEIHSNYRLYPGNYIAFDTVNNTDLHRNKYSFKEQEQFNEYIDKQIDKIAMESGYIKDEPFLRLCLLQMYANPVQNYNNSRLV